MEFERNIYNRVSAFCVCFLDAVIIIDAVEGIVSVVNGVARFFLKTNTALGPVPRN